MLPCCSVLAAAYILPILRTYETISYDKGQRFPPVSYFTPPPAVAGWEGEEWQPLPLLRPAVVGYFAFVWFPSCSSVLVYRTRSLRHVSTDGVVIVGSLDTLPVLENHMIKFRTKK